MPKKSELLARERAKKQEHMLQGWELAVQEMTDCVAITLHNPEIMGKNTFSGERVLKFMQEVNRLINEIHIAFTDNVEADVAQRNLDAMVQAVFKDKFQPFYERYPDVIKIDYSRGKKVWRDGN